MPSYANSEKTRMKLILAAGELFAEHGIDAVTTREIAEKSGENIGVIHYHFGGKDGLVDAVVDFACELWKDDPLGRFLEEHRHLLAKTNGQNMVIGKMVDIFLSTLFSPEKPSWCCTLAFQLIQRDMDVSGKIFQVAAAPGLKAFMSIYHIVSEDNDFERAFIWNSTVLSPAVLYAIDPHSVRRLHPRGMPSDKFLSKLKMSCIQNALSSINFLRKCKEMSRAKKSNLK